MNTIRKTILTAVAVIFPFIALCQAPPILRQAFTTNALPAVFSELKLVTNGMSNVTFTNVTLGGTNTINSLVIVSNIVGNAAGLTNIPAGNVTGTLAMGTVSTNQVQGGVYYLTGTNRATATGVTIDVGAGTNLTVTGNFTNIGAFKSVGAPYPGGVTALTVSNGVSPSVTISSNLFAFGNVSIGTTTPDSSLMIVNDGSVPQLHIRSTAAYPIVESTAAGQISAVQIKSASPNSTGRTGAFYMSGANTAADSYFGVSGNNANIPFKVFNGGGIGMGISITNNPSAALSVMNGNVGIGTTTPTNAMLEVRGGIFTASNLVAAAGISSSTITLTNNPTLNTTNAAPGGFILGTTLPVVWFAVTNSGNKYLIPGFAP